MNNRIELNKIELYKNKNTLEYNNNNNNNNNYMKF